MPRDLTRLLDILQSAQFIQAYVRGMDESAFLQNFLVQDAVVRRLEIIGEAARNVSDGYRESHPEISWQGMIGMRNRMIHEYQRVDYVVVWKIVQNDIPALITVLEPLVPPDEARGE